MFCVGPIIALVLLVYMVIWLSRSQIGYVPVVIGAIMVGSSFLLGLAGHSVGREIAFRWNYRSFHEAAAKLIANPSLEAGKELFDSGRASGVGVFGATHEEGKEQLILHIETASGPSSEAVAFSPEPIEDKEYTFKLRDDLGYWYFVD